MFGFIVLLMIVASIASMVGGIWLTVVAFRRNALWGLAVFFIPFANIVYAVKFWDEAKKPFLLHFGSGVACFFIVFLGFFVMAGQVVSELENMEVQADSGMSFSPEPEPTPVARTRTTPPSMRSSGYDIPDRPRATPDEIEKMLAEVADESYHALADPKPGAGEYMEVSFDQASSYAGDTVRVTGTDGSDTMGRLSEIRGGSLFLERELSGGLIVVEMARSEIRSIEVVGR